MAEDHTRQDDAFMRGVVWLLMSSLVTVILVASGGFFFMYGQLAKTQEIMLDSQRRIQELEETQEQISRSMSSIDKGVGVLVALAVERNNKQSEIINQQKHIIVKQNLISEIQQSRTTVFAWAKKEMMK